MGVLSKRMTSVSTKGSVLKSRITKAISKRIEPLKPWVPTAIPAKVETKTSTNHNVSSGKVTNVPQMSARIASAVSSINPLKTPRMDEKAVAGAHSNPLETARQAELRAKSAAITVPTYNKVTRIADTHTTLGEYIKTSIKGIDVAVLGAKETGRENMAALDVRSVAEFWRTHLNGGTFNEGKTYRTYTPEQARIEYEKALKDAENFDNVARAAQVHLERTIQANPDRYLPEFTGDATHDQSIQFSYELGQNALSQVVSMGLSAATGGLAAPLIAPLFGIWSATSKYAQIIGAGSDATKAYRSAMISGVVNWVGEYAQLSMFGAGKGAANLASGSDALQGAMNTLAKNVSTGTLAQLKARLASVAGAGKVITGAISSLSGKYGAKAIVGDIFENAFQEFLESSGESIGDWVTGVETYNEETLKEAWNNACKSAVTGAILAGATTIVSSGVSYTVDNANLSRAQQVQQNIETSLNRELDYVKSEIQRVDAVLDTPSLARLQTLNNWIAKNHTISENKAALGGERFEGMTLVSVSNGTDPIRDSAVTAHVARLTGQSPVDGIYTMEEGPQAGVTVHEKSFMLPKDIAIRIAAATNQESVALREGGVWKFVNVKTGEQMGDSYNGIDYHPATGVPQTKVQTSKRGYFSFTFTNVPPTPENQKAIQQKVESQNPLADYTLSSSGTMNLSSTSPIETSGTTGYTGTTPTMNVTTGPFLGEDVVKALPVLGKMNPHEIMRWAGLTEEEIAGMSERVVAGFGKRVEKAYQTAVSKYGKDMENTVAAMVKPFKEWGLAEYASIRKFSASILGEENVDFVTKILAATSAGISVGANITQTEKALRIILTEGRLPTMSDGFMTQQVNNIKNILAGVELPKVGEFAKAIIGDENALVIDRWMARFWFNAENPTDEQRLVAKVLTTQVARKMGLTAREMQAAIWQYARETSGEKKEGSYIKYGEMKAHADEIKFLQELLAKRNAVNQQPIADEAGNINAITPFATDGTVSPRAAAAKAKLDKRAAVSNYTVQFGNQNFNSTTAGNATTPLAAPVQATAVQTVPGVTGNGFSIVDKIKNKVLRPIAAFLDIKKKPIDTQSNLDHTRELWTDDLEALRNDGMDDGSYKQLSLIRSTATQAIKSVNEGMAMLPDGKGQLFVKDVKLASFSELGDRLRVAGKKWKDLNDFSIIYAALKGFPVNKNSMQEVNLVAQGSLAKVQANAQTLMNTYSVEDRALYMGIMDEAHRYILPMAQVMAARGMIDTGGLSVEAFVDRYVSAAPKPGEFKFSSPIGLRDVENVSHTEVVDFLDGIGNAINHYAQFMQYNEYVKNFAEKHGYVGNYGKVTFFDDAGNIQHVQAPVFIERQLQNIINTSSPTWGFLNNTWYRKAMALSRFTKIATPAFAQLNLIRDGELVLLRYGVHPVTMIQTIFKQIGFKAEKASGLVGMGTPNETEIAKTKLTRMLQYTKDNLLGISESLMRNYAYNVESNKGKSDVDQMYALIAGSTDFTVHGSSQKAANLRGAWQFAQASLNVAQSWDMGIKEVINDMNSPDSKIRVEAFTKAATLLAVMGAAVVYKEREKEKKELADYIVDAKIPIRIGNKIIAVPESFSTGTMMENSIASVIAGIKMNQSLEEITSELALDVYGGIVGYIGRDSDFSIKTMVATLSPTLFEPIVRSLLNVQYGGRDVDPYTYGANWTHYFKSTSQVAKNIAVELHDNLGIDVSPVAMEFVFKSYLGRYGTYITKMDETGATGLVSDYFAQQFVVPVPEGIKTQAYSDWNRDYAKVKDDLLQARKNNYKLTQDMADDLMVLEQIDKLFSKQTTTQAVYALSIYGLSVLESYKEHKKER